MTQRVLVTRPIDQAQGWVENLRAEGFDAHALPLIGIAPLADPRPVAEAWRGLESRAALMFVSANAVAQFFAAKPVDASWPRGLLAAAPGPGTASALRALAVPGAAVVEPSAEAVNFDSEALWAVLSRHGPWPGGSVLIVRGAGDDGDAGKGGQGREWLAERWREAGARVETLAVYRRGAPVFDEAQLQRWHGALAAPGEHVVLLSSSEAIEHGDAIARSQRRDDDWHRITAVATHPRIAASARAAGFARVVESAPALAGIAKTLRALRADDAPHLDR